MATHEPLTDKMVMHFYELKKLPPLSSEDSGRDLWLKLFKAETEEELKKLDEMEVPIMSEAIKAYRHISASSEFKEYERLLSKARHDEAQALRNAEQERDAHWQGVVATKDNEIDQLRAQLEELRIQIKTVE